MKQQSAIRPLCLCVTLDASRTTTHVRKLRLLLAVLTTLRLRMAANDTSETRYNKLGHLMICMCDSEPATGMSLRGCKQVLLECTHVECEPSKQMRRELRNALQKRDSDEVIVQSFARTYGADAVEQGTTVANKLIWILAFAILTAFAIAFSSQVEIARCHSCNAPRVARHGHRCASRSRPAGDRRRRLALAGVLASLDCLFAQNRITSSGRRPPLVE